MGERATPDGRFRHVSRGRAAAIAGAAVLPAALAISAALAPGAGSAAAAGSADAALAPNPTRTLSASPTMRAWGTDSDGELGDGSRTPVSDTPVQVKLPSGVTPTATRAGCLDSVALTSKGTALAWGNDSFGQLGDGGSATARSKPVTVKLPKGTKLTSVRAGCAHDLALTSTGKVLAWGLNNDGQLGDGTTRQRDKPVRVSLPKGTTVVAAVSGLLHALALTKGGKVLAWGDNQEGQLGIGTTTTRHRPVFVTLPKGTKVSELAAGKDYSLALTTVPVEPGPNGTPTTHGLLAWGGNETGQLGTGTTGGSLVPVAPKLSDLIEPMSVGSGWGSVTSIAICVQQPV
jgi:alpha-tubulin suppressor-like RCC1 family protein